MNRIVWTILGFVVFTTGFLALILGFIGLGLWPLTFLDKSSSPLLAFGVKLAMMVVGLVVFYVARVPRVIEEQ